MFAPTFQMFDGFIFGESPTSSSSFSSPPFDAKKTAGGPATEEEKEESHERTSVRAKKSRPNESEQTTRISHIKSKFVPGKHRKLKDLRYCFRRHKDLGDFSPSCFLYGPTKKRRPLVFSYLFQSLPIFVTGVVCVLVMGKENLSLSSNRFPIFRRNKRRDKKFSISFRPLQMVGNDTLPFVQKLVLTLILRGEIKRRDAMHVWRDTHSVSPLFLRLA